MKVGGTINEECLVSDDGDENNCRHKQLTIMSERGQLMTW